MFTGIIQSIGVVKKIADNSVEISYDFDVKPGDSVAVNGVCLTVNKDCAFDLMDETLNCTNLGGLQIGDKVNLETGMKLGSRIDGHLVSGHVDFVSEVLSFDEGILRISFPLNYGKFFAIKGSVCINGVSLTISKLETESLEVSLVDFTLKNTNLGDLKQGDKVNVEIDLIARYLERMVGEQEEHTKYGWLKARNFL